jgi:hypothetical protein
MLSPEFPQNDFPYHFQLLDIMVPTQPVTLPFIHCGGQDGADDTPDSFGQENGHRWVVHLYYKGWLLEKKQNHLLYSVFSYSALFSSFNSSVV